MSELEKEVFAKTITIMELKARIGRLEAALREIDTHLDNFGYGRGMKARKMIAVALFKGEE